jgi:hypothetical protein
MSWDAAPVARGREPDLTGAQIDAKHRFNYAIACDRGWLTSSGASFAPGRGCAMPRRRSLAGAGRKADFDLRARSTGGLLPRALMLRRALIAVAGLSLHS